MPVSPLAYVVGSILLSIAGLALGLALDARSPSALARFGLARCSIAACAALCYRRRMTQSGSGKSGARGTKGRSGTRQGFRSREDKPTRPTNPQKRALEGGSEARQAPASAPRLSPAPSPSRPRSPCRPTWRPSRPAPKRAPPRPKRWQPACRPCRSSPTRPICASTGSWWRAFRNSPSRISSASSARASCASTAAAPNRTSGWLRDRKSASRR